MTLDTHLRPSVYTLMLFWKSDHSNLKLILTFTKPCPDLYRLWVSKVMFAVYFLPNSYSK